MSSEVRGVVPILATTFDQNGKIDYDSQIRLVRYLLAAGAHALGLFGNASEGYALTAEERRQILALVSREVDGRVPLVVAAGHTGTDAAVEACREAEDLGADALMVLPPYYMKTDGDGILFYFDRIGGAVQIPIMVQDAPLMTQVVMPAPLLAKLSREVARVEYVKVEAPPTGPKFTQIANAGARASLFGGLNGQFLIEEFARGSKGVMPGSDLIPEIVQIWNRLSAGDTDGAWELFVHILPLIRFELQPGLGVSAMKHNLVARGIIDCAAVRHPTGQLDAQGLLELEKLRCWVDNPHCMRVAAEPALKS